MRHMRRTHAHTKVFCQDRTGDRDVLSMTSDKFRGDQAAASDQRSLGQRYIWDSLDVQPERVVCTYVRMTTEQD